MPREGRSHIRGSTACVCVIFNCVLTIFLFLSLSFDYLHRHLQFLSFLYILNSSLLRDKLCVCVLGRVVLEGLSAVLRKVFLAY